MKDRPLRSKPPTGRRSLLVVRAGDDSLHPDWLRSPDQRNFDLLVSYYGTVKDRYRDHADHYHVMSGPRWPAHHAICRDNAALIASYDHVCFACDDLGASTTIWNDLFAFCEAHALDLAQPTVLGSTAYTITAPIENCLYRVTNFVEIMCPVFSRRALAICQTTFSESISGWGLSSVWPKLLGAHGWTVAIIDAVSVRHMRPLGEGTLYHVLSKLGVDPQAERLRVMARYGIEQPDLREVARIDRPQPETAPGA